ncbi:MFS transporter [Nonomuraea sp. ATR24]|uniref:MFS transporter n=1 Tax=unclassified Nonomuraea TaxID=2593643 RepID=UPI0034114596
MTTNETRAANVIDDAPMTPFHRRLALFCSGGPLLDGLALGVIGLALPPMTAEWRLDELWQGALAASALLGLFAGGFVFGYVTDLVGRKLMYTLDIAAIAIFSGAQFFVTGPEQLLVLRLLLGVAIGADYPIATSLLAEFAPRRSRATLIGLQTVMWSAGNALAYLLGLWVMGFGPDAWRWLLMSPALVAAVLFVLRIGTPESPRWLITKGRGGEALAVTRRVYGESADLDGVGERRAPTRFRTVFQGVYLRRTVFVALFWTCSVTPLYAIYAFAPQILQALRISDDRASSVAVGGLLLLGCVVATLVADRMRRRTLLIWPMAVASGCLVLLGVLAQAPPPVILLLAGVYALAIGGPTILQWIYPNEIFPTEIRATAFGIGVAASRIGAVLGTFVVPSLLDGAGISLTMVLLGAFCGVGVVASAFLAPETYGRPLNEAAT